MKQFFFASRLILDLGAGKPFFCLPAQLFSWDEASNIAGLYVCSMYLCMYVGMYVYMTMAAWLCNCLVMYVAAW